MERTSSAKLDEMISFQKSDNNDVKTVLTSKNINKGKSILGTPPKLDKKETKNPRAKKSNNQKFKQKKQHLCYHCGAIGHTRPNFYKWLTTQQCNSMISSGNQNQFPSSFAHLGDLLKALMFLLNLNGFNSSPSPLNQGFAKQKGLLNVNVFPRCGRKNAQSDSVIISLSLLLVFVFALLVCFVFLF